MNNNIIHTNTNILHLHNHFFVTNLNFNGGLKTASGKLEADVIVIGSGLGGHCRSGLLARYNQNVLVLRSHDLLGGAAHSFDMKGYKYDSGPSLFSGLQSRGLQANSLAQVMWNSVERAIVSGFTREKCEVKLVGTPLTHKRFLQRNRDTYAPTIQAGKDTNTKLITKITNRRHKENGVPKIEPKINIPTMRDIIASSKQQKLELKLQTLGPFFRITAKRLESEEEIGRADGIIRLWFGGKILHLDSIKLSRETLGMEKSIFGIGVFLGAVAIRYGYDCGCTSAELLAINDSDLYHKKLVRFYTRIGFKKVYEVTGSSIGDYSHMLIWGGVGTRMEANVEHLLVKWCTRFIPKK